MRKLTALIGMSALAIAAAFTTIPPAARTGVRSFAGFFMPGYAGPANAEQARRMDWEKSMFVTAARGGMVARATFRSSAFPVQQPQP